MALYARQDFGGRGIDHPGRNLHYGAGLASGYAADAVLAQAVRDAPAGNVGLLIVPSELRDATDDDGIHAEHASDLGCAGRVGAVAVRKILLADDLVEFLALDYGIGAAGDEPIHQNVGYAFTDVLIGPKQCVYRGLHRRVVEIHDGDALLLLLCLRCGENREK